MRKFIAIAVLSTASLCGQSSSSSSTTQVDINGHRVSDGPQVVTTKSGSSSDTTEKMQSINGRMVPLERVEENVLRDDSSGRVVERIIRRYDQQGNPTRSERHTIEEVKRPNGSTTTDTTYRSDLNGAMQLAQKSVTEVNKSGSETRTDTMLQRPTINGSLDTVEKQNSVKVSTQGKDYREETTTYRTGGNGGFYAAVRTVTDHSEQGKQATDNTVEYEADPSGPLQMHSQKVTKTSTAANGSKDTVVDIYSPFVPGTVDPTTSRLKLQEEQLVQSQKGPNNTVTETLSVRRPTVSDPSTLGPARQLSQTVCTGAACQP